MSLANIAFDRTAGNNGITADFPGTGLDAMYNDLLFRNNADATVDITIGGLLAGTYQITTHHLHFPNTPSEFDLNVQDADSPAFGQFVGNFAMGLGDGTSFNPTIITFEVESNGSDDIIFCVPASPSTSHENPSHRRPAHRLFPRRAGRLHLSRQRHHHRR